MDQAEIAHALQMLVDAARKAAADGREHVADAIYERAQRLADDEQR